MFTRRLRLRLPQSPGWQCCCHRDAAARFSTGRRLEDSSPSSPSSSSSSSLPPSLYDKLFRGKPGSKSGKDQRPRPRRSPDRASSEPNHRRARRPSRHERDGEIEGNATLAGDELRAWLEKEAIAAFELESARAERYHDVKDDKKILVMPHMSRSLAESDFYRYAPQGRHVAGWAGGIVKVVQSVSPVTREPRGQYFIFFDSASAARAYLNTLDASMHQAQTGSPPPLETPSPPKLLSDVELASFMGSGAPIKQSSISPPPPEAPPPPRVRPLADSSIIPYALGAYITGRFQPKGFPVLVRLAGSKITVEAMTAAVEADGAARNLPWRLVDSRPSVAHWPRQVQSLRAGSGKIALGVYELHDEEDRYDKTPQSVGYGYTRFVITFADAAEARRFARTWNRREMVDDRTARTMLVNTTALWA